MNVFITNISPLETAKNLDKRRLFKQIIESIQILDALEGRSEAWRNHPATLQYAEHIDWLKAYSECLLTYREGFTTRANKADKTAQLLTPAFHNEDFFNQMKRRLFTKDPEHYAQWSDLGTSDENWYWSPAEGKIIRYVNGKRQDD